MFQAREWRPRVSGSKSPTSVNDYSSSGHFVIAISVRWREEGLKLRFDTTDFEKPVGTFLCGGVCALAEFGGPNRICRKCSKSGQKYRYLDPKEAHPSTVHALRKLVAWAQTGLGLYCRMPEPGLCVCWDLVNNGDIELQASKQTWKQIPFPMHISKK